MVVDSATRVEPDEYRKTTSEEKQGLKIANTVLFVTDREALWRPESKTWEEHRRLTRVSSNEHLHLLVIRKIKAFRTVITTSLVPVIILKDEVLGNKLKRLKSTASRCHIGTGQYHCYLLDSTFPRVCRFFE